ARLCGGVKQHLTCNGRQRLASSSGRTFPSDNRALGRIVASTAVQAWARVTTNSSVRALPPLLIRLGCESSQLDQRPSGFVPVRCRKVLARSLLIGRRLTRSTWPNQCPDLEGPWLGR